MATQSVREAAGIIDRGLAAEAVALALPSIQAGLRRPGVSGEGVLHLVVMDPLASPVTVAFDDAVLYEHSVGDPATWGAEYQRFAREKAALAWRAGCDTHLIQELRPHLLRAGDTLLWGSVARNGLVVAASGAHPWFDEAFANTVAGFLLALAQERARRAREDGLLRLT